MPAATASDRVLIVEDDPELGSLLAELLRSDGFDATHVLAGQPALDAVAAEKPDAIVLDVMLPDMSGFEVCRRLKLHRDTNLIPILMLTALSDPASLQSGLRVGANRYLTKPFDPARLTRELKGAIAHRRELEQRQTHTSVAVHMRSDVRPREQLNDLLSELFVQTPLTDEQVHEVRFAALEMIQNAAEWGNKYDEGLLVTIDYEVTADALRIVVTDEGAGFDPQNLPHATAADKDPVEHLEIREKLGLRDGGFGIFLTRGLVDEFAYNAAGNQVTLVKRFRK